MSFEPLETGAHGNNFRLQRARRSRRLNGRHTLNEEAMKYEPPYGAPGSNDPYINGNPATGTMGSIPPAASIENPQREIVNFIGKSNLTPTDADLFQLARAVQSGVVNYGLDTGTPNQIAITPTQAISAYAVGQRFIIKVKYGNTTLTTINVSGLGNVPVIHCDLTPLNAYELIAGQLIDVAYDGSHFQVIGGVGFGGTILLKATQELYVNPSTGSDTLYDGTSATVGGTAGPFQTIQKAIATMKKYNLGGWNFIIHLADGGYVSPDPIDLPLPNGSGIVSLLGNTTNPNAVSIFNSGTGSTFTSFHGGNYDIQGAVFTATAPKPGDQGHCLWWMNGGYLTLGAVNFYNCPQNHVCVGAAASCNPYGPQTLTGNYCGGAHYYAFTNGVLLNSTPTNPNINISVASSAYAFAWAVDGGQIWPIWNNIFGAGNFNGYKYVASTNGVINSQGRGASYLPGTAAGFTAAGGQYL
jgi:hypothetical protein